MFLQLLETYRHLINALGSFYDENESRSIVRILLESEGFSNLQVNLEPESVISDEQYTHLCKMLDEILSGRPVQYVLGETEFYGLKFKVNSHVLIPRPETEELADMIIKENNKEKQKILDIGTGSGCIAVTLACKLKKPKVFATDISEQALAVAGENAIRNNVTVKFIRDDILQPSYEWGRNTFDIIVSNPPYVVEGDIEQMRSNVLNFEPPQALFAHSEDQLIYYRKIFDFSKKYLSRRGLIYCEINEKLGKEIERLALSYGFENVEIRKDINGRDRVIKCASAGSATGL